MELPRDILQVIATYLDVDEICILSKVCKQFYRTFPDICKVLIDNTPRLRRVTEDFARLNCIDSLIYILKNYKEMLIYIIKYSAKYSRYKVISQIKDFDYTTEPNFYKCFRYCCADANIMKYFKIPPDVNNTRILHGLCESNRIQEVVSCCDYQVNGHINIMLKSKEKFYSPPYIDVEYVESIIIVSIRHGNVEKLKQILEHYDNVDHYIYSKFRYPSMQLDRLEWCGDTMIEAAVKSNCYEMVKTVVDMIPLECIVSGLSIAIKKNNKQIIDYLLSSANPAQIDWQQLLELSIEMDNREMKKLCISKLKNI